MTEPTKSEGGAALPAEHAPPEPSAAAIDAAARLLWQLGNVRIGVREWGSVRDHYLVEARDALRAAYAVDCGACPALAGRGDDVRARIAALTDDEVFEFVQRCRAHPTAGYFAEKLVRRALEKLFGVRAEAPQDG